MAQRKKLIIFDFDGTIADTLPIGYELYQHSAEKYKLKKFADFDEFQTFLHLSLPQMLFRLRISPFLFKKIIEEQLEESSKKIAEAQLFPGIDESIHQLAQRYTLAIVSSSFASVIEMYLQKHHLRQHFALILGSETHKDKKEKIRQCLDRLNMKAQETILVGDSTRDIKDGKKLGLTTIAVVYGIHPLHFLEKEKPHALAHTPAEIIKLISSLDSE